MIKDREVYEKAVEVWGTAAQLNMVIEECCELIIAIQKFRRRANTNNLAHMLEEIADVSIMLEQMKVILDSDTALGLWHRKKMRRLIKRLKIKDA